MLGGVGGVDLSQVYDFCRDLKSLRTGFVPLNI